MDPLRHVYSSGLNAGDEVQRLVKALKGVGKAMVSKHRKTREIRFLAKQRKKNAKR